MTTKIMAIETSTNHGSVAIVYGHDIVEKVLDADQKPSVSVLSAMEMLLAEMGLSKTQLDAVSYGKGPGSFTGVRLATGVANMMAFSLSLPTIPVSTLAALAQQGWREHGFKALLPALDARLNQIYWGYYQYDALIGLVRLADEEKLENVSHIKWPLGTSLHGIGDGWDHYHDYFSLAWKADCYPKAYDIASIALYDYQQGKLVDPLEAQPFYVQGTLSKKLDAI